MASTGLKKKTRMKPKYPKLPLRTPSGILLLSSITICIAGIASAADLTFNGTANDGNWTNTANWATGIIPGGSDNAAVNNGANAGPNITTTIPTVSEFWVGTGSGNSGSATLANGGSINAGAWTVIGRQGGTGTFNQTGGTFTQVARPFIVGTNNGSNGTFNQTGGTLNISADRFLIGENAGSTGTVISSGTINVVYNAVFGPGTGSFTLNEGGVLAITGNTNGTGEFQIGQGTTGVGAFTQNGGNVTVNNWVSVGRGGGQGTFTLNGGTFTKSSNGSFLVGDGSKGTFTQTGGTLTVAAGDFRVGSGGDNTITSVASSNAGLIDVQTGRTQIGENGSVTASLTISGSAQHRTNAMIIGAATTLGTLNANGGTLTVASIAGGSGVSTANFNGAQIIAKQQIETAFISSLNNAVIGSGGLLIDTAGFNLAAPQEFSGSGNIVKSGLGTLSLTGEGTHTGDVLINAGVVALGNQGAGGEDYIIANNAGLGLLSQDDFSSREVKSLTFGTTGPTSLDVDLGNFPGNHLDALVTTETLVVNGTVTVNVKDENIELGLIPLINYTTMSGTGSFEVGDLPLGVTASIVDDGPGVISLNVTSLAQPKWDASVNGVWDTTTANWTNAGIQTTYSDGNATQFDDLVSGLTQGAVTLNSTVTPSTLTFENSSVTYSITGTGNISGDTGIVKRGGAPLTLNTTNSYTGATNLQGGVISINSIANAGTASSIGAASVSPSNLILNGASLSYTGATASTDRGLTISAIDTTISTDNQLTISGEVLSTGTSNLIKAGNGNLILSGTSNKIIGTVNKGLRIHGGGVTFSGTGTNNVASELWVGGLDATGNTSLTVTGSNLTTGNWIAVGPENGTTNRETNVTFTDSTVTATNGGISLGYANGLPDYKTTNFLTLNNSTFTGATGNFAESNGATATIALNGTSALNLGQVNIGINDGTNATMSINDTSSCTATGRVFIGQNTGSTGVLTISDEGSLTCPGQQEIQIGISGQGTLNLNGGTVSGNGWMSVGRGGGGTGTLNITAGTFTQAAIDRFIHIGEYGAGTLNISGTGAFIAASVTGVLVGEEPASSGVINLDGGSLTATAVVDSGSGTSAFHFNGGLLIAGIGANPLFMNGLDTVTVKAGGARIDSNSNNITINPAMLAGTGNGGLTKTGGGTLTLAGANTYTGNTTINAGTLTLADDAQLKFAIGAIGVNTTITGTGGLDLDGDFNIDTTGANVATGNNWQLVNVGSLDVYYGGTFNVIGFTNTDGVWTKTDGPATWTFTQETGILSVVTTGASGYSTWSAANAGGQGPEFDFDNDGVKNGVEFFMGATGSTFTATPGIVNGKVTWPKSANFSGSYRVETSSDMVTWTNVTGTVTDNGTSVTYTLPTNSGKLFVRLAVNPN